MVREDLKNHFYDFDLQVFPIDDKRGVGHEFKIKEISYITEGYTEFQYPDYRVAYFTIKSYDYVGVHYYGGLNINTLNKEVGGSCCVSGYLGGHKLPKECEWLHIGVLRRLPKEELDKYPVRWEGYKENSLTNAFNSEDELIEIFKKCLPFIFKGKWLIKCEYWTKDAEMLFINN